MRAIMEKLYLVKPQCLLSRPLHIPTRTSFLKQHKQNPSERNEWLHRLMVISRFCYVMHIFPRYEVDQAQLDRKN
ncbi:hypothetical protein HJC23_001448 [Cyclotella cryptica]|uniref:Uncharacterized protein n=1 Tax=Cyclotella cryptica TaxID=29204 RepID=A0ABD3PF78_9STRA